MNEHAKATNYFKRTLKLDKDCLVAWSLMEHEYLEMKLMRLLFSHKEM